MHPNPPPGKGSITRSALAYFGLVFGAGFLLGAIRVPFVVPRVGVRTAELLEMPLMILVIAWAARFVVRRFALAPVPRVRLAVGCLAFLMLIGAELAAAWLLQGQSPGQYIAGRDAISGSVYLFTLGLFALMPLLA